MLKVLLYVSILLNILDVVLHVVTDQVEALRIAGNIIIIISAVIALVRWRPMAVLIAGLASYLALNCIFIIFSGIGTAGIAFVSLTTILITASLFLQKPKL